MKQDRLMIRLLAFVLLCSPAHSQQTQQKSPEQPRAPASFDPAAIRRQATQLAEFRALLADPDPNVRLLAMREAIRAGDASQRQVAIEAGLSSSESAMVEMALRGSLVNIQQIVIEFVDTEGKPIGEGQATALRLVL